MPIELKIADAGCSQSKVLEPSNSPTSVQFSTAAEHGRVEVEVDDDGAIDSEVWQSSLFGADKALAKVHKLEMLFTCNQQIPGTPIVSTRMN
jgi:hypothetical protein